MTGKHTDATSPSKGEVGAQRREGVGGGAARPGASDSSSGAQSTPTPALPLSGGGGSGARFNRTKAKTARARRLRRDMTDVERKLWRYLRRDLVESLSFRRQHPMGDYILDFYCPRVKLAIELDGSQHGEPAHASRDRVRDDWLASQGIVVLRVWNGEIMGSLEGVWETIRHEALRLAAAAGNPITSPSKGEVGAKRREGVGGGGARPAASDSSSGARSTPTPALPLSGGGGSGPGREEAGS
jgi:very-short-patch-repair endonuclease